MGDMQGRIGRAYGSGGSAGAGGGVRQPGRMPGFSRVALQNEPANLPLGPQLVLPNSPQPQTAPVPAVPPPLIVPPLPPTLMPINLPFLPRWGA